MLTLHGLTIKSFHEGLLSKKFSAFEITKEFFNYIEERDQEIGAYLTLNRDGALAVAAKVDVALAAGEELSPLAGVPLAIKDNMLVQGLPATAASKILKNYRAAYDATVVKKLKGAQAVILGKTNMDEFAMGSSTENSAFKITKNPHDLTRVPGGSSGGSAAAVAGHMAVAALGSDTGGSIREPASFCGVVGLKPTYGAVSRYGLIAMASSLDQIGPLTKTVEDAALLFKEMSGVDKYDSTSVETKYGHELLNPSLDKVKKLTIGLPEEYFGEGIAPEVVGAVEEAIVSLKSLGIKFKTIKLPHTKYALSCYYIIMPAEVSSNLARFDGIRYGDKRQATSDKLSEIYSKVRGRGFGKEARRRIILGSYVLSSGYYDAYYAKAQKVRRLINQDFDEAFKKVDVILGPVSPTTAFKIGEKMNDPLQMYLSDIFTIPVNLAGLPAISIPVRQATSNHATSNSGQEPNSSMSHVAVTSKLPVGFQLISRHFREEDILGIGNFYERL
ncbi:MAG: Asp-tRNA(Asn)/Glu-tRNA(Gln) amidotransferase subunit GatA [bacterium]|nr:Asp-tRNA(Asn)/Glu-tRNA(Gln) amidotransferase subunit GatA [bacterium]